MENKNEELKLRYIPKSIYSLHNKIKEKSDNNGGSEQEKGIEDSIVYLHKDGIGSMCPFMSSVGMDWETKSHGLLPYLCGSFCQHFHVIPETKKVLGQIEGKTEKVEKTVPTGKIRVALSCGSNNVSFPISNI